RARVSTAARAPRPPTAAPPHGDREHPPPATRAALPPPAPARPARGSAPRHRRAGTPRPTPHRRRRDTSTAPAARHPPACGETAEQAVISRTLPIGGLRGRIERPLWPRMLERGAET